MTVNKERCLRFEYFRLLCALQIDVLYCIVFYGIGVDPQSFAKWPLNYYQ